MSATIRTTWPFPFFQFQTTYQENSQQIRFGNGYVFASQPSGPPQRIFKLNMEGMRWDRLPAGGYNIAVNGLLNLGRLDDFYRQVECWKPFIWQHPIEGPLLVRFYKPLNIPKQIKGGNGVVDAFEVELIEVPNAQGVTLLPETDESLILTEESSGLPTYLLLENGITFRTEQ